MNFPKLPIDNQKKAPKLNGEVIELGKINTGKKTYNVPVIQGHKRSELVPRAHKPKEIENEVEKRGHWSDTIIPGMFLDADYKCNIIRSIGKKNEEIIEYDWQIMPSNEIFQFPINRFYVDTEGNLHLNAKVDGSFVSQIILNDENLAKLYNNISSEPDGVVRKRSTSSNIDSSQLVEICTLSYGDYNSAFRDAMLGDVPLKNYIHYDRRDYPFEKDGTIRTKYCGALMCHPEALEDLTLIVKQLGAGKKSLIFNN